MIVLQREDFSISVEPDDNVENLEEVIMTKHRAKEGNSACHRNGVSELWGVLGCEHWLTEHTQPDLRARTNILQQCISDPKVGDLKAANQLVKLAREGRKTKLIFKSIAEGRLVLLPVTDASWADVKNLYSEAGYMVCALDCELAPGKFSKLSPLGLKSWRPQRHCQPTLAAETMALKRGLAEVSWMAL